MPKFHLLLHTHQIQTIACPPLVGSAIRTLFFWVHKISYALTLFPFHLNIFLDMYIHFSASN